MISTDTKELDELRNELKKSYNVVLNSTGETIEKVTREGAKEMRGWQATRGSKPSATLPKESHGYPLAHLRQYKKWDDYFKSWTSKVEKTRYPNELASGVIYSKKYPLVHLLENGHIVVMKGVPVAVTHAFPHVEPIYEFCNKKTEEYLKKVVDEIKL